MLVFFFGAPRVLPWHHDEMNNLRDLEGPEWFGVVQEKKRERK